MSRSRAEIYELVMQCLHTLSNNTNDTKELMILINILNGESPDYVVDEIVGMWLNSRLNSSNNEKISYNLLKISLLLPDLRERLVLACIDCVQKGSIRDRVGIYCISEIRIALLSHNNADSHCKSDHIIEVANVCIKPFLDQYDNSTNIYDMQQCKMCLDLIPCCINVLFCLRKRYDSDSVISETRILELLLSSSSPWTKDAYLPLLNVCIEIYPYLKKRFVEKIQELLIQYIKNIHNCSSMTSKLKETLTDDYAGIMCVCLHFLEKSNDIQWINIFRILYHNIPTRDVNQVEVLLEQFLTLSPSISRLIIDTTEDLAVTMCKSISMKTFKNRQKSSTHVNYDGIPLLTMYDLRLLLLVTHVLCGNNSHGVNGELALPNILTSADTGADNTNIRASRAIMVLLLALSIIFIYDKEILPDDADRILQSMQSTGSSSSSSSSAAPTASSATSTVVAVDNSSNNTSLNTLILQNSKNILLITIRYNNSQTMNWVTSMRSLEIIAVCLNMACHSYLTQPIISEFIQPCTPPSLVNDLSCEQLLMHWLLVIFETIEVSRPCLLSAATRGIIASITKVSMYESNRFKAHGNNVIYSSILAAKAFLLELFDVLCTRYPGYLSQLHQHIQNHILLFASTLPVASLTHVMTSISRVCYSSTPIFGYILNYYRKNLLHKDTPNKLFAVSGLIQLLEACSVVSSASSTTEIVPTLLHALSLPLYCRRTLYHALIAAILSSKASIQRATLLPLQQKLMSMLSQYYTVTSTTQLSNDSDDDDDDIVDTNGAKESATMIDPFKCIEVIRTVKGAFKSIVNEDISSILVAIWVIEMKVHPNHAKHAIITIANIIINLNSNLGYEYSEEAIQGANSSLTYPYLLGIVNFLKYGISYKKNPNFEHNSYQQALILCSYNTLVGLLRCLQLAAAELQNLEQPMVVAIFESIQIVQAAVDLVSEVSCNNKSTTSEFTQNITSRGYAALAAETIEQYTGYDKIKEKICIQGNGITVPTSVIINTIKHSLQNIAAALNRESNLKFPFTTCIGSLSYACYEAGTAGVHGSCDELHKLWGSVIVAYKQVASLTVEDSLLRVAIDQSKELIKEKNRLQVMIDDESGSDDSLDAERTDKSGLSAYVSIPLQILPENHVDIEESSPIPPVDLNKKKQYPLLQIILDSLVHRHSSPDLIDRWDVDYLPTQKNTTIDLKSKRLQDKVWNYTRNIIFSLRNEILWSLHNLVQLINKKHLHTLTVESRVEFANYLANELLLAVKDGLTVRTFRAYLDVMSSLACLVPASNSSTNSAHSEYVFTTVFDILRNSSHCSSVLRASLESLGACLVEILGLIDSSHVSLIQRTVKILVMFCGWRDSLQKFELFLSTEKEATLQLPLDQGGDNASDDELNEEDSVHDSDEKGSNVRKDNRTVIICEMVHTMDSIVSLVGSNNKKMDKYYSSQVTVRLEAGSASLLLPSNTSIHNINYITNIVARCIFNLFSTVDEAESKPVYPVFERMSDRRKGPIFASAAKFIAKCSQDCTKITRLIQYYKKLHNQSLQSRSDVSFYSDDSEVEKGDEEPQDLPQNNVDLTANNTDKTDKTVDITTTDSNNRSYQPSYFLHALLEQVDPMKLLHCRDYLTHNSSNTTSTFVKYAHSLALKIDELQWKLLNILNDIDKGDSWMNIEVVTSTPVSLQSTLQLIDSNGRALLSKINKVKQNNNKKGELNKKNKRSRDESDSEYSDLGDNDDENLPEDSDDDDETIGRVNGGSKLSKRSQMSINFYSSSGNKHNKRLRSRNQVIDDWLEGEGGDDAFADLEDFIE